MDSTAKDTFICVHRRAGKALALDAVVETPLGPKRMGDLTVGEKVCTPSGRISKITEILPQGKKLVYRIYLDDGSHIDSCEEHEWEVYTGLNWTGSRKEPRRKRFGNKIITTREIYESHIHKYSNRREFRYKLNPISPVEYEKRVLPIDPYLLGVLLGDGCMKTGEITSADPEIIDRIIERNNLSIDVKEIKTSVAKRYFVRDKAVLDHLTELNLRRTKSCDKFIPTDYLFSSVEDRLDILQGLMDTDGSADPAGGNAEFCSKSEALANGVTMLARSLGCKASVKKSKSSYTKNGKRVYTGDRYRVYIIFPAGLEIFSLNRKVYQGTTTRYLRRTIIKVEKLEESVDMQCISIEDPAHLFITNHYIPTHNCAAGDTRIIDPETLRPIPISEASHVGKTLVFDMEANAVVWSNAEWIRSGQKKCLRFLLGNGTDITLSEDHPVFDSKKGWIEARYVRKGDRLLAPSKIPIFGDSNPTDSEVEVEIDRIAASGRITDAVFSYSKTSLRNFLKRFWYASGRIFENKDTIAYMVWNYDVAVDIRHLLLRFEIDSFIDEDGNCLISDPIDRSVFLNFIGLDSTILEVRSPRRWEVVAGIKNQGYCNVYDLSVEHEDHNFVASDIVIHNSYSLSVIVLWHAVCHPGSKIIIFAPSSTQIEEFFKNLDGWIHANPFLADLNTVKNGNFKNPHYQRTFVNRSTIAGYILSEVHAKRRGLTGDVIVVDEAQELEDDHWAVVNPIMRGDQYRRGRLRNYIAGTTKSARGYFYDRVYKIGANKNTEVIFIPVTENKDPAYSSEYIEELREETPEYEWRTEWLLEVSESDNSVFKKSEIDLASSMDWEYGNHLKSNYLPRFIGVDWDKAQAGSNIVVGQYDPSTKMLEIIDREEVPRSEFHYTRAVQTVLNYCEAYQPELVVSDQGQGEYHYEQLVLAGMNHPELGMDGKFMKLAFQEVIELPNPESGEWEKKMIKPYLVGQLQQKMQDRQFSFPSHDHELFSQLLDYKIVRRTARTTVFSNTREHIIDGILFILYGIHLCYEGPYNRDGEANAQFRVFRPEEVSNEWQQEANTVFWNQIGISGRSPLPGSYIPRSSLDSIDLPREGF